MSTKIVPRSTTRLMLNKVPEVTVYFWVIKILCTTVGESFADYINETLGFGLFNTTVVFSAALVAVLIAQFRVRRYVPGIYWLAVVLISVVGTLLTDNLTDGQGVPLWISTTTFSVVLAVVFGIWYARERTLSIHTIVTTPRESFYWLAVLVTFALGTATGDWTLDLTGWSAGASVLLPLSLILAVLVAWRVGAGPVLSFWLAYILTRPLGANIGDYLASSRADDGLGLGTFGTSLLFLGTILVVVIYLTVTDKDRTESVHALNADRESAGSSGPSASADRPTRVMVVTDHAGPTDALLEAVRSRSASGATRLRVVVLNPARTELHLLHPERHDKAEVAEATLLRAIPDFEAAAGGPVVGSVSVRHDAMDAIEEVLYGEPIDEIMLSVPEHPFATRLHQDLPHRLHHHGIPVTVVS
jgi:uncharacterized membrane-anchored protein